MFCINNDCGCYGTDLGEDNFCSECGAKCVNESPTAANEKQISEVESRSSIGIGIVKNIVAGDQYNSTTNTGLHGGSSSPNTSQNTANTKNIIGGNQHISTTTVLNQDETRTVRICAVSGRQAMVVEGYVCPSCSNWVHLDYFYSESRMCANCIQQRSGDITQSFRAKVQDALQDGILTKDEIIDLKRHGTSLGISEERQNEILKDVRTAQKSDKPLSTLDRVKLKTAMSQLCKRESSEQRLVAFKSLKVLQKTYPSDLKIASLLVLAAALNLKNVIDEAELLAELLSYVDDILSESKAFSFDSPEMYLIKATYYRALGLLLDSGVALEQEKISQLIEFSNFTYQQEAANLETLFPESPQTQTLQVAAILDHFFETGESSEIHQEISNLLQAIDCNADGSSAQQAIAMLRSSWSVGNLSLPPPDNVETQNAEGLILYELLFSWNLHSIRQSYLIQRDTNISQFQNEPEAGSLIVLRIPKSPVSLEFCGCPPGSYMMGSRDDEPDSDSCEGIKRDFDQYYEQKRSGIIWDRRVPVTFTQGFWMGRTTITFEQWTAVAGDNLDMLDSTKLKGMPALRVTWNMAVEFCERLNAMKLVPEGWAFSLPREAQWEYACRAGTTGPYAGNSLDKLGWFKANSGSERDIPHPVARKAPNPWGIFDMHGNVREHCLDWYSEFLDLDVSKQGKTIGTEHVVRGGCFHWPAKDCRSASRHKVVDGATYDDIGFRICIVKI